MSACEAVGSVEAVGVVEPVDGVLSLPDGVYERLFVVGCLASAFWAEPWQPKHVREAARAVSESGRRAQYAASMRLGLDSATKARGRRHRPAPRRSEAATGDTEGAEGGVGGGRRETLFAVAVGVQERLVGLPVEQRVPVAVALLCEVLTQIEDITPLGSVYVDLDRALLRVSRLEGFVVHDTHTAIAQKLLGIAVQDGGAT